MWTITFELRCYLMLTALGMLGIAKRRNAMLVFAVAMVVVSMITAPDQRGKEGDPLFGVSGYMIWFATIYLSGVCFYLFRERIPMRWLVALAASVIFAGGMFGPYEVVRPVMLIAGGYALFYVAHARSSFLAKLRVRDDLSYGIYLYGWPVTKLIAWWIPSISSLAMFATALITATALAFVSWRVIEEPALRLKRRPREFGPT